MLQENEVVQLVPFNINSPQYPQSTYYGRVMNLFSSQNPFNFYLPHSRIEEARMVVEEETKKSKEFGDQLYYTPERIIEIRKNQNIFMSAAHPDTGEYIPRLFRLCSYASISVPIIFGMLLCKPTTFNIIFFQWTNQTYSAGLNYANRNASSSLDTRGLLTAYGAAVTTSIWVGLGVRKLLSPFAKNLKGPSQLFTNFLVTLSAVGSAGFLNLIIMRSEEIKKGIILTDDEGVERGRSWIIGRKAVVSTAMTRFLMPVPPLIVPTLIFYFMESRNLNPKNKFLKMGLEMMIFFVWLGFGPPLSCGVFEQTTKTHVDKLEPEFHNLKDSNGNFIKELWYNKGL
jgi:sideroflexin-5